jgi:hypothetical protein
MRTLTWLVAGSLLVWTCPALAHIAEGTVTMTAAAEVPAPTGVSAGAGGTATFELEDDNTLTYDVTVHDLTGDAVAGHIHEGAPGVPGGIIFPFTQTGPTTFAGTTVALTADQVQKLLSGAYYVNVHTLTNLAGEIRGQMDNIEPVKGTCSCQTLSRKEFRKCVRAEVKKLDKDTRTSAAAKALKRAANKSSCGLTQKKKTIACCVPQIELGEGGEQIADIVTGELCLPVKKDAQCTKFGGTSLGAASSCFPTNPCSPPASPSGAFVD